MLSDLRNFCCTRHMRFGGDVSGGGRRRRRSPALAPACHVASKAKRSRANVATALLASGPTRAKRRRGVPRTRHPSRTLTDPKVAAQGPGSEASGRSAEGVGATQPSGKKPKAGVRHFARPQCCCGAGVQMMQRVALGGTHCRPGSATAGCGGPTSARMQHWIKRLLGVRLLRRACRC